MRSRKATKRPEQHTACKTQQGGERVVGQWDNESWAHREEKSGKEGESLFICFLEEELPVLELELAEVDTIVH